MHQKAKSGYPCHMMVIRWVKRKRKLLNLLRKWIVMYSCAHYLVENLENDANDANELTENSFEFYNMYIIIHFCKG